MKEYLQMHLLFIVLNKRNYIIKECTWLLRREVIQYYVLICVLFFLEWLHVEVTFIWSKVERKKPTDRTFYNCMQIHKWVKQKKETILVAILKQFIEWKQNNSMKQKEQQFIYLCVTCYFCFSTIFWEIIW
jgi:hypothetical protein